MTAFNLPAGVRPSDLPGNRPSDDEAEAIFEAFEEEVKQALATVPGITDSMTESILDLLTEGFGDVVLEKRRIDRQDER